MTPDNAVYYHAAYIAAGAIYVVYILTLLWRVGRARQRLRELAGESERQGA
ncbi:MAG TPA: hypothetical protein VJ672_13725 [Gemmatimonadaceae bacterium]|nr:hypothetical protein [Gemmatimonadaceae bacterium]